MKEGVSINNIYQRLLHFGRRVERRLNYLLQYYSRKTGYHIYSKLGINTKQIYGKKLDKFSPQYKLKVFLNRSLDDIDRQLRTEQELCKVTTYEGELALQNTFLVLNEHRPNMYDLQRKHYRWTEDFFTGYRYPDCFYQDVRKSKTLPLTDIKIPWETSRMQTLFALALSYRATKEEKYVKKILDIIKDFSVCCPCGVGVNWNVSMEAGIRISNIILACELIQDSNLFDDIFRKELMILAYEHMLHIRKNLENEKDAGNHYLADILGLAAVSVAFPFLPGANNCRIYTEKSLHRELLRQILPDGGDFEGSTSYHRLVGEILGFTIIALKNRGFKLTNDEIARLKSMCNFTYSLRMDNGLVPQLGDNDSGRVFQLAPENTRNHDSFLNLLTYIIDGKILFPGRKDGFCCFFKKDTQSCNIALKRINVAVFKDFGLLTYRDQGKFIAMCGMTPEKYLKPGHAHNDLLSFVLTVGNEEFITDPGSGEYTGNVQISKLLRSINSHSSVSIDENEQRLVPIQPKTVFDWGSSAYSVIQTFVDNNNHSILKGKCSYISHDSKTISHERTITINESEISIEDVIMGMMKMCTFSLPLFPGLNVEIVHNSLRIFGKNHMICISGSWNFEVCESVFAEHYKKLQTSYVILCKSNKPKNKLIIEII